MIERLNEYGLHMNVSKFILVADEIEFLGYLITAKGSCFLSTKVQVTLDYKLPATLHDLRIFLGILNVYRRYLRNAA